MILGFAEVIFLFSAAIITMALTVVAGMGGGVMLFAAMAMVIDYALLIPLFGAVQSGGATARVWIFRKHIHYRVLGLFLLAYIPCAALGVFVWIQLIALDAWQPYIKMALAFYIVLFVFFGRSLQVPPSGSARLMLSGGALAGIGTMTVGAVAPIMAPFFIALRLNKNEFSGTWAVASFIASVSKLPLLYFIWDRLEVSHGGLIFVLFAGSFIGAYLGKLLFDRTSEVFFRRAAFTFLFLIACKLFVWDGAHALMTDGGIDKPSVVSMSVAGGQKADEE
ncbi:MAG: sulfite exporter TauE/SafE family protein [Rhodospirillales bacterium]